MASTWHSSKGEPLATCLFNGASYASAERYPMDGRNVIDIGLCIIKRCVMYAKEYNFWISHENVVPPIIEMINSIKEYIADAIALINQTAVPASQHRYGMTAVDDNAMVTLYGDSLANFGAAYAATQETLKSQADSLVAMQNQLANIQQFCMTVGQQPPSSIYTPTQQQRTFTNHNKCNKRNSGGQNSGRGVPQQPTISFGDPGSSQQQAL